MKLICFLLLVTLTTPPITPRDSDDICEAILRFDATHNKPTTGLYFVYIHDESARHYTDPADGFLKRFSDGKLRVKKGSESGHGPTSAVIDPKTGERGTLAEFGKISVVSFDDVEVGCSMMTSGDSGGSWHFKLKRTDAGWEVASADQVSVY